MVFFDSLITLRGRELDAPSGCGMTSVRETIGAAGVISDCRAHDLHHADREIGDGEKPGDDPERNVLDSLAKYLARISGAEY